MDQTSIALPDRNQLLAALSKPDGDLLRPHLQPVDLPKRMQIERPNVAIEQVYFPNSGFASMVTNGSSERNIEIGMIGREGVTGLAILLGTDRSPQETFMQADGVGQRIAAAKLSECMEESPTLRRCLLNYVHVFTVQLAQTCLANGRSKLEERLARWLLMAQDRIEGDELDLTHEFLAYMLCVRRPGVTVALKLLEGDGLIQTGRGLIIVIDREGLEQSSNGSYGAAEAEHKRLFG